MDVFYIGAAILIADINDTRDMLKSLSLSKTLPVGTSDAGSYFNNMVLGAVDYGVRSSVVSWHFVDSIHRWQMFTHGSQTSE